MASTLDKTFDYSQTDFTFRDVLEYAPVGFIIFSNDFRIKFVNKHFFQFAGVIKGDPETLIGKSIYEFKIFEEIDLRKDLNELKNGIAFEKELTTSRTLSGSKISVLIKCVPIKINDTFSGGIIIIEDIKISAEKIDHALIESSNFQNFLFLISDCYCFIDRAGNIRSTSPRGFEEFDFLFEPESSRGGARPRKLSNILFKKLLERVLTGNNTIWTDIPFFKEAKEQIVRVTLIPFIEESSHVDTIIVLAKKISRETETQNYLAEEINELRSYQQIITNILDGVIGLNKEGKIIFWNESSAKLFGLTRSEVYGKFIGKIFHQIDETYFNKLKEEIHQHKIWEGLFKIGEDDSIAEYFSVRGGVIKDEKRETFILLCSNITERARVERELRQSEERFRNIVINSNEFICTLDLRGRITYTNPRFIEVFMYNEEEIAKLYFTDIIDSYYLMNTGFNLNEIKSNIIQTFELPLITKLGQRIHVLASFATAYDISGAPQYFNVILTDVTLKRESEKDLLLIRSLFEASHDGIALICKKKFVLINDSFVRMFGYRSASEIIGRDPLDFINQGDTARIAGYIELAEDGGDTPSRYDFTGKRRNNTTFEVENSVSTYETEDEKFIVWVLRDVTDEKKAKEALRTSEERYRSISENINESFWTAERIDGKLQAVFYTPGIKKITGYSDEAFLNDPHLWKNIIHPDDTALVIDKMQRLYGDSARTFESFEYRIIDAQGNIIWLENKITLKRDSQGEIQKIFGIVSDVSLAKRAEEEVKKSTKDLKELNETKDRFISIVSHDLRTPFTSILGFTDFLLSEKDMSEEKRVQYIQFIQESAKSMLSLVNSLLDWTRLQTGRIKFEPERINAKIIIDKSIQILSGAAIQKNIKLISELELDFYIYADENLLLQVFNNLISNAIKFTQPGGNIRVISKSDIEKRQIQFSVKDSGVGIAKEDIQKLFKVDSKFTTAGTIGEKGSGLGLSLVHDIIHKHGGEIWVESEIGKGSEFIFTIPVASTAILLVDDIKTDRMLYSKLLQNLIPNYTILEAENGKAALEIIKQSSPALVITDHKMPVMSGYDLVKQLDIADIKYKPPVIILSSDMNPTIEDEYREMGVEYVFQKPVNLSNFKNAIERSLRKAISS